MLDHLPCLAGDRRYLCIPTAGLCELDFRTVAQTMEYEPHFVDCGRLLVSQGPLPRDAETELLPTARCYGGPTIARVDPSQRNRL
jgi:hypothetical protein